MKNAAREVERVSIRRTRAAGDATGRATAPGPVTYAAASPAVWTTVSDISSTSSPVLLPVVVGGIIVL